MTTQHAQSADYLVYLHGFRSSSGSVKAVKTRAWMQACGASDRLWQPDLPASPKAAMAYVSQWLEEKRRFNQACSFDFIGSSLGGFYASVLAERFGGRAVLLNPAVTPWTDLQDQIGRKKVYFSDAEIEFVPEYLSDLHAMNVDVLTHMERYFLLACLGDEVLDAHAMIARYQGATARILEGGDHAISDFELHLPWVMQCLGWGRL